MTAASPPSLGSFDWSGVREPAEGILYLYKSRVTGFWGVTDDQDMAVQEATGYPVGELQEDEALGDGTGGEVGHIIALYVGEGPGEVTRREKLRARGWSADVETRRARRPQQKIRASEREHSGGHLTITPSWLHACTECGEERRIASEALVTMTECSNCGTPRPFEPVGELHYPDSN